MTLSTITEKNQSDHDEVSHDVVIESRNTEAAGVISLKLVAGTGVALPEWSPGAHIDVELPTGVTRQYSLCGDPEDRKCVRIAVLREPDGRGGSAWIHDNAEEGRALRIRGPRNHFPLLASGRYLFIAGGIGITPILPMIAAADSAGAEWSLLYGGRQRTSMAFLDELSPFGDKVTIRPEDEFGPLDLPAAFEALAPGTLVYCCGPARLIDAVESHSHDWRTGTLHVERFAPVSPPHSESEQDTPFEVECRRSGITVTVPAQTSVLDAVEAAGVGVLSSCRQGICGSCETAVLAGEVDHRDSLLTEEERSANDTMMVCVSRARNGRLLLDL